MSFGVLFNFAGNSNISQITTAATMVNQTWFIDAVNYDQPIDLFLLIGHNPVSFSSCCFLLIAHTPLRFVQLSAQAQSMLFKLPSARCSPTLLFRSLVVISMYVILVYTIQCPQDWALGGQSRRTKTRLLQILTQVFNRYCETLGWLSMSGVKNSSSTNKIPSYVPQPSMPAVAVTVNGTTTSTVSSASSTATSDMRYFRRYLDWNR